MVRMWHQYLLVEIHGMYFNISISYTFTFDFYIILQKLAYLSFLLFNRGSSPSLCQAVIDGIEAAGGECTNYGVLSTPQLHFFVVCKNTNGEYGKATEEGYYEKIGKAFNLFGNGVSIIYFVTTYL